MESKLACNVTRFLFLVRSYKSLLPETLSEKNITFHLGLQSKNKAPGGICICSAIYMGQRDIQARYKVNEKQSLQ
jgi:hypothetical protein